ncbi:cadherin-like domain-containing protein [Pseudomonas stutzeri]|nr:cadherin-like domain-containing protein [Stutzerimonas stutzeri]
MNDAPLANDDSLAATEDTPVTFSAADLLGNDSDVDGDSLSIASVVHRSHVDRDGGGVGDQVAVGHRVAEGGYAVEVGIRGEGHRAVGITAVPPVPLVTLAMLRLSPSTSLSLPSRSAAAKVTGVSSVAARLSSRRWPTTTAWRRPRTPR